MALVSSIRLASHVEFDSIVDGPGLRIVLWAQGCPHHCEGCHNPQTWNYEEGKEFPISEIIAQIEASQLQSGLTLSGGEPFEQAQAFIPIVLSAKKKGLNIWAYTGYLYEELLQAEDKKQLLELVDVLVDGKFILAKKDFRLWYKGSSNQRIINVPASLACEKIVLSEYEKHNIISEV
ncbi:MAG: anaerobic ribonucleoside-triphosphate reductase activating protein [Erysipelotrichia bacterium]|nr:anaerobic ribonucleoside-triphosphate reductase activating protein [Erysipelotrichia bacterium]NCC54602.1 anaerobic ribonucleoside-triphosphate reductase activating protein [Erysipelotrichia bacterium]